MGNMSMDAPVKPSVVMELEERELIEPLEGEGGYRLEPTAGFKLSEKGEMVLNSLSSSLSESPTPEEFLNRVKLEELVNKQAAKNPSGVTQVEGAEIDKVCRAPVAPAGGTVGGIMSIHDAEFMPERKAARASGMALGALGSAKILDQLAGKERGEVRIKSRDEMDRELCRDQAWKEVNETKTDCAVAFFLNDLVQEIYQAANELYRSNPSFEQPLHKHRAVINRIEKLGQLCAKAGSLRAATDFYASRSHRAVMDKKLEEMKKLREEISGERPESPGFGTAAASDTKDEIGF